jgi:hypothetical protein
MEETFNKRVQRALDVIRSIEEGDGRAPTAEEISESLQWSIEVVHFLLHRMVDHGVLIMIPSAYDERYSIEDEDLVLTLPDPKDDPTVGQAHEERKAKFQEHVGLIGERFRKNYVDPEKSKVFDEVKARLSGAAPQRANPLDAPAKPFAPAAKPEQDDLFAKLSDQLTGKKERKTNPLDELLSKKKKE